MQLIDIFVEPAKTFAELKERPNFLVPLLLMMVFSAVMVLLYFNTVDPDWLSEHQLAAAGKEMSATEIATAKEIMPAAKTMGTIGAVAGSVMIAVVSALMALYYMLAGKITGTALSFKHGMSMTTWSAMPTLLGMLVAIIGVLMMEPQTALESLMLTNLDPLLVQLPTDHAWSSFAKAFNLLSVWAVALAAIGWRVWTRSGWGQAITVAAIPTVLIYGVMAAMALAKG